MIYEKDPGFCFVHIYKVAGQSIKLALRRRQLRHVPRPLRTPVAKLVELPFAYAVRPLGAHATADEIRQWLGPEEWDRIFTFTFVRNPWDWQVSLYHFIQHNWPNRQRGLVRSMSFDEYIRWRVAEDKHLQSSFVVDSAGNQIVDFVGRFEHLADDFGIICQHIGWDLELPHENVSKHAEYRSYYTDETAALVAEHFAEDIARFDYSFDQ
jgi:hypothetical protein